MECGFCNDEAQRRSEEEGRGGVILRWRTGMVLILGGVLFFSGGEAQEVPQAASVEGSAVLEKVESRMGSQELFEKAMELLSKQQDVAALSCLIEFVQEHPTSPRREEALYHIAECYYRLGKIQDAQSAYTFVVQEYPQSLFAGMIQLRLGDLFYRQKEYKQAMASLKLALEDKQEETQRAAQYFIALCQLEKGETKEGRASLTALLQDPQASRYTEVVCHVLAESYEATGEKKKALEFWKKLGALTSEKKIQVMAFARSGWLALGLEEWEEAEKDWQQCRELTRETKDQSNPSSPLEKKESMEARRLANTGLLRLFYRQERHVELLELVEQEEVFLDAIQAEKQFAIAQAYFAQADFEKAAKAYTSFLQENPKHPAASGAAYKRLVAHSKIESSPCLKEVEWFLENYESSAYMPFVLLMKAQALSTASRFSESIPIWEKLDKLKDSQLPQEGILFEGARAYDQEKQWKKAAETYRRFREEYPQHPSAFIAQVREAMAWQNEGDFSQALRLWEDILLRTPQKSSQRQMALEQIGLLAQQQNHEDQMIRSFEILLKEYPQTSLAALASFTLGEALFRRQMWEKAEPTLLQARHLDPSTYDLAATERLALLAFATKQPKKTAQYQAEYDEYLSGKKEAPRLPAALYYWLGQKANGRKDYSQAARFFLEVVEHPQAGALHSPSLWQLAEAQRHQAQWVSAIKHYEAYRRYQPEAAQTTEFLLALAEVKIEAHIFEGAQQLIEKAMIQVPEGDLNAQARWLLGEFYFAQKQYLEAAKAFATLSLLYEDPQMTPRALQRAISAYESAGEFDQAKALQSQLQQRFPHLLPQGKGKK